MNALLQIHVKIHYHVHMNQPLVPIPFETNSAQNLASKVFRIHFNIFLSLEPRYPL